MLKELSEQYSYLDFFARQLVEGFITGMHRSPFHGFSVEFAEHRLYNTGESTRNIDWRLFARTDQMFVKKYEEETNLRAHLVLDCSSSMYFPENIENNKLNYGVKAAAVLAYLLKKQRDAYGLTIFSDKIDYQTPVKSSTRHYTEIIRELENVLHKPKTDRKTVLSSMLHEIAEKIHRRSLVILITDLHESESNPEDLFNAFNHLKFKNHELIVFHIQASKEENLFEYDNRPHKFVDAESGEEIRLIPKDVKEAYLLKINEFMALMKNKSAQYAIDYHLMDIYTPFEQIILNYLIKRQKLF